MYFGFSVFGVFGKLCQVEKDFSIDVRKPRPKLLNLDCTQNHSIRSGRPALANSRQVHFFDPLLRPGQLPEQELANSGTVPK